MHITEESRREGEARRVFAVVCRGRPEDFQMWLESAKTYEIYIVYTKSTRASRLVIKEVPW